MPKEPDTRGFDPDHIEYLTHHARQMHSPDDFDHEVQDHLDSFQNEAASETEANKGAIRNISQGSAPRIPGAPKPPSAPSSGAPPPLAPPASPSDPEV